MLCLLSTRSNGGVVIENYFLWYKQVQACEGIVFVEDQQERFLTLQLCGL
jgi:hypothetical protein